ncbi:MAG: MFS transporter [Oscillospiraceae bacterium]|jgi:melibiose permease|nr:MFS transporter [Oscillospiraceae bacterium]
MQQAKPQKGITALGTAAYSMSSLGRQATLACVDIFYLSFLTIYMGLDVLVVTAAIVLIRVLDALANPLLASVINNSRKGSWGRYRPWMMIGAACNSAALALMFLPIGAAAPAPRHAYYIAMFLLWGLTFTLLDVPVWAMIPTIANTTEDRNKVTSMSRLVGSVGGFVVISLGTSLVIPRVAAARGISWAHFALGLVAAGMLLIFISVTSLFARERFELPENKIAAREVFGVFRENDQLAAHAISYLLLLAGITTANFQQIYIFIYYGDMGGLGLLSQGLGYTVFSVLSGLGMAFAMMFYQRIVRKIPREKVYGASFFIAASGMAATFLAFFALRGQYGSLGPEAAKWANVALVALAALPITTGAVLAQIGSAVMVADIADYGEWKNGRRSDSVLFSVQTLLTKLTTAAATLLVGAGLKAANLPAITQRFNEALGAFEYLFVDEAGAAITTGALDILRVFMYLAPIPLCVAGFLVWRKKYWLHGERYARIKREVDARREAGLPISPRPPIQ